jgi:hypothetical protein
MTKHQHRLVLRAVITQLEARNDPTLVRQIATLHALLSDMHNRRIRHASGKTSVKVTPKLARDIVAYHRGHRNTPQHTIATRFHVNQGRVNEVLNGVRQ